MNLEEDVQGREFDWFAIDKNGHIAIISTAGSGDVPRSVLNNYGMYDLLSEQLETPNWGTERVWEDYANYGLFVFNWQLNNGPYKKISGPKANISDQLKSKIENIVGLPVLDVVFTEITELHVENT